MSDDRDKVDGEGFNKDEFSPEERAVIRHWLHRLGKEFMSAEEFVKEAGLKGLRDFVQSLPLFVKIAAGWATIGGAVLLAAQFWG